MLDGSFIRVDWPQAETTPLFGMRPRGEGTGDALVRRSLRLARRAGHEVVFLVGDRGYYDRYGFEPAGKRGVVMPDEPKRLLVRELRLGALQGIRGVLCPWKG